MTEGRVDADVDCAVWEEALEDDPDTGYILYEGLGPPFINTSNLLHDSCISVLM